MKSHLSDVVIPEVAIHEVVFQAMKTHRDKVALVDGITGEEFTYGQVLELIHHVASGLKRHGLQQRDVFAILSANSPSYVFVFYAALACGASVTPINPLYKIYEVCRHLEDSHPKFVFTSPETVRTAMEAIKQTGLKQTVIVSGSYPGCLSLDDLMADDGSLYPENITINVREDVATIPYSSGTTGLPKGVMITHYNLVAMVMLMSHPVISPPSDDERASLQDICISYLPFFHAMGMVALLIGKTLRGSKQILLPRFEAERFLQLIPKYKVTSLLLVPPVVVVLAKNPQIDKYDFSSIESVTCGAAPLAKDTEQEFRRKLKVPPLLQGYGMTETTLAVCYPAADQSARPGSSGMLLPNMELQVVDPETKRVLGPNVPGELWVKGPNIMKGYLNKPEATRLCLDSQGWLHTGDIGYYDTDGYVYIVDRLKELIKYKGFQVAPAELEALILSRPDVSDVAVIGIADHDAGEVPKAFVVRKPGTGVTESDIKKYVADRLATFKHLRGGVQFVSTIPKTQTGKILRQQLRAQVKKSKL